MTPSTAFRVVAPRSMVRVRKLRPRFDHEAYFELLRDLANRPPVVAWEDREDGKWVPDWEELKPPEPGPVRALITLPRAVGGRTYDLELRAAKAWIRDGELQLSDLIDVGRGWESVEDCVDVSDEVDELLRRSRFQRWLIGGLILAGSATVWAFWSGMLWFLAR